MKTLTTFLVFLISIPVFSQVTIWPKAGSNLSWTSGYDYFKYEKTSAFGFYAGVAIDIPVSKRFSIRPEIIYNEMNVAWGYTNHTIYPARPPFFWGEQVSDEYLSQKESRRYLSIPLNLVTHFKVANCDLQVTLGGYISRAVDGTFGIYYVQSYTDGQGGDFHTFTNYHATMHPGDLPTDLAADLSLYNPLDIGLNGGLGYQIYRLLITTQFLYGLTSTLPHSSHADVESYRKDGPANRSVSLGVAYRVF